MGKRLTRISQRDYAKLLGVSNTHVSNAVKDKLIVKGWDAQARLIIVEHADREWGDAVRKIPKEAAKAKVQDIQVPVESGGKLTLNGSTPKHEAQRIKEIFNAQLLALELQQKKGELVPKAQVEKHLAEVAVQLRTALETYPERVVDRALAAKNRNEAMREMGEAMRDLLDKFLAPYVGS